MIEADSDYPEGGSRSDCPLAEVVIIEDAIPVVLIEDNGSQTDCMCKAIFTVCGLIAATVMVLAVMILVKAME